jgi:hypothetical protein
MFEVLNLIIVKDVFNTISHKDTTHQNDPRGNSLMTLGMNFNINKYNLGIIKSKRINTH